MKSVMKHNFSQVPRVNMPRSSFDRSHGYKTTFNAGDLEPIYCDEVIPGDTFDLKLKGFARLSTPIHPVMDNMFMDTHFFFIPLRLIWTNSIRMFGERENPDDSIDFTAPTMVSHASLGHLVGSLSDKLGIPTQVPGLVHNSLAHRAYNKFWNDWFRDQNLQDRVRLDLDDGPDTVSEYTILKRGKRHDYFTSCLTATQKGEPVSLPLGTTAPIIGIGFATQVFNQTSGVYWETDKASTTTYDHSMNLSSSVANVGVVKGSSGGGGSPEIYADLTNATSATVNQLRVAIQVQTLLERDMRGGTRYIEIIKSHFGVTSPDARLQRSEYLGGGSTPINISPVAQQSSTDGTSAQGNLAAFGTAFLDGHGFKKSFTEHGIIIGVVSVRADLTYQQGLDRMFSRSSRYDWYWPALSQIGEQAVLKKEIFAQGSDDLAADETVFGYQEQHADYRYKQSKITGAFRSNYATSLDVWHLSQELDSTVQLGPTFIEENPPVDRVVAVTSEPQFIYDSYIFLRCTRVMPLNGIPASLGKF